MQDKIFISLNHNYYENIHNKRTLVFGDGEESNVSNKQWDNGSKATLSISGQAQNILSPAAFVRGFSRDDRAPYSG